MLRRPGCPLGAAALVFFAVRTSGGRPDQGGRLTEMAALGRSGTLLHRRLPPEASPAARRAALLRCLGCLGAGVVASWDAPLTFRFLAAEAERLGARSLSLCFIDMRALARRVGRGAADCHSLEALLDRFGAAPRRRLDTALGAALAGRALFWKLTGQGELATLADAGMKPLHWNLNLRSDGRNSY